MQINAKGLIKLIDKIYDKTSKISFSTYGDDFLRYFGEYAEIIHELGTEIETLKGRNKRLDKLVLVDDGTLQNWEFEFKDLDEDTLKKSWGYNNLKSAETGKIVDSFIVSFGNPDNCDETFDIGRSIHFAPIIKYFQKMGLPEKLKNIEEKVRNNEKVDIFDELTLIFVTLSAHDKDKQETLNRVCDVLKEVDYIDNFRRKVIDSLIAFQIENFIDSQKERDRLNRVVDMQMSVEELFKQVFLEDEYDKGFDEGYDEGKNEMILNLLKKSASIDFIEDVSGCSRGHILKIRNQNFAGK